jgi:hypothetical protein
MPRKRPTVLTVFGILNIVFGSLGLVCYSCIGFGLVVLLGGGLGAAQDPQLRLAKEAIDDMLRNVPGYVPAIVISLVLGVVLALILIISGIGLLYVQGWARIICIIYSIISILSQLGALVYRLAVLNPALERWANDFVMRHGGGPMRENPGASNVWEIAVSVFFIGYAVALLVVMFLPQVSAAFAGWAPRETYEREFDRGGEEADFPPPREDDRGRFEEDDRWGR